MKQIILWKKGDKPSGLYALVDDSDFEFLSRFTWYPLKRDKSLHAIAKIEGKMIAMHQLLLPLEDKNFEVDHKNNNGLDNQRENLRPATRSQNLANNPLRSDSTTGFKGVTFNKRRQRFMAYITCKGITRHLGYFENSRKAAEAYNKAAFETFGEFAKLNELI